MWLVRKLSVDMRSLGAEFGGGVWGRSLEDGWGLVFYVFA